MNKLLTVLALLLTSTCFAQVELSSVSQIQEYYVAENGDSKLHWVNSKKVRPGKNMKLVISYHNTGKEPANGLYLDNPVPKDSVYVEGSAIGNNATITYSVDGGKNYSAPAKLEITENSVKRAATAADYTGIRWTMQQAIEPGAKGSVEFQVKVK